MVGLVGHAQLLLLDARLLCSCLRMDLSFHEFLSETTYYDIEWLQDDGGSVSLGGKIADER